MGYDLAMGEMNFTVTQFSNYTTEETPTNIDAVYILPEHPTFEYNLTAVPVNATGNNASVVYNWFKNDVSITVLNMPFNNESVQYDISGMGNDGTVQNGASWTSDGQVDGAMSFDGIDDHGSISDSENLN